jgi:hypothetical protein
MLGIFSIIFKFLSGNWLSSVLIALAISSVFAAGVYVGVRTNHTGFTPKMVEYKHNNTKHSMQVYKHDGQTYYPASGLNTLLKNKYNLNLQLRNY